MQQHRERMFVVFQKAMTDGHLSTAHKVAVTLAQLDGLLTTFEIKGTVRHEQATTEQRQAARAVLERRGLTPLGSAEPAEA